MKQTVLYCCEFCEERFEKHEDAVKHEASHYGLDKAGYCEWASLCKDAADAGKLVEYTKNRITDLQFDRAIQALVEARAIQALVEFENKHGLTDKKRPTQSW